MTTAPLLVLSHHGAPGVVWRPGIDAGRIFAVWEWELSPERLADASGLVTTMHLDQIRMAGLSTALVALLARGGRIALCGHVVRPFLPWLRPFVPSGSGRRADLTLTLLADHPVFEGVDRSTFQTRQGVAGFYGRGHNPMPEGGVALTGVGESLTPLDWAWTLPGGGELFSHAGNDPWTSIGDAALAERLVRNLTAWAGGA